METSQIVTENTAVLETPELTLSGLKALISGEVCILVVRKFCDSALARRTGEWFLQQEIERYDHEIQTAAGTEYVYYGVDRVGFPFNKTLGAKDGNAIKERYYQNVLPTIRALRTAAAPALSPIDQLRLELDELWPSGAGIAAFEGKKMLVGIGRVMHWKNSAASEIPHFDAIPPGIVSLDMQLAANIYLVTPPNGGELEVWNMPQVPFGTETPPDRGENWRNELPEPVKVQPHPGDLIFFNSGRPHAIRGFTHGSRVSVQCFVGVSHGEKLRLWN